ncbi:General secretion pathway protein G [hydrothermal vent metagenome]|uniref:Type II secretion system core protein G n=1 Tax=hydrothermal vent metagenome TaxID=652676 RepID=A0A3B0YWY5_9ZZZZ
MTQPSSRGFTLIELMVIILIIGLLAGFVAPKVFQTGEDAKRKIAATDIDNIITILDRYKLSNGAYPSTEQGLKALIEKPTTPPIPTNWQKGGYVRKLPRDPWARPYQYLNTGSDSIYLYSQGPKKDSEDDDIGNKVSEE